MAEESFTRDEESSAHALTVEIEERFWRVKNYKADAGQVQGKDGETRVKIPKVTWDVLRRECYEPKIVSIGPYHYNKKPELRAFQDTKVRLANMFASEMRGSPSPAVVEVDELRGKVSKVAGEAKKYYSQDALGGMTDEEFTWVMFLDGCFVLGFMCSWLRKRENNINLTQRLQMDVKKIRVVVRDLLLFDNQVPFMVLEALSASSPDALIGSVVNFLSAFSFTGIRYRKIGTKPIHLLDLLSLCICDPEDGSRRRRNRPKGEWLTFPNVRRLEEAGIDFWPTQSRRATAISFTPKLFTAELRIPPVFIGEHSMTYWVNLAAYQNSYAAGNYEERPRGSGAAEYIWMLDKLIDDAEDMRKLQAKQIIFDDFKDDQKVVALFRETMKNITTDYVAMTGGLRAAFGEERVLMKEIQHHVRRQGNKYRMWVYKNMYFPYFRSPWSIPAFLAALIGLILTFFQVYYTIYPR